MFFICCYIYISAAKLSASRFVRTYIRNEATVLTTSTQRNMLLQMMRRACQTLNMPNTEALSQSWLYRHKTAFGLLHLTAALCAYLFSIML